MRIEVGGEGGHGDPPLQESDYVDDRSWAGSKGMGTRHANEGGIRIG